MVAAWLFSLHGGPAQPAAGYSAVSGSSPTHRRRGLSRWKAHFAASAIVVALFLLNNGTLMPENPALVDWTLKGCPVKILDLTTTMEATYQVRRRGGALCRCRCCRLRWLAFLLCLWLSPPAAAIHWGQAEGQGMGWPAPAHQQGCSRAVGGGAPPAPNRHTQPGT